MHASKACLELRMKYVWFNPFTSADIQLLKVPTFASLPYLFTKYKLRICSASLIY